MYVHLYDCVSVMHAYISASVYMHMYMCMCIRIYVYMCLRISVCVCICVCICMCICIRIYAYLCVHIYAYTRTRVGVWTWACEQESEHTYVWEPGFTHTRGTWKRITENLSTHAHVYIKSDNEYARVCAWKVWKPENPWIWKITLLHIKCKITVLRKNGLKSAYEKRFKNMYKICYDHKTRDRKQF